MSLEALVVVIVAVWAAMNFLVTPAVRRSILSQPSQSALGGVFRLGIAEGISTTAVILATAGVVTLMSLWVLQHWAAATDSATSLESFDAAIGTLQSVQGASVVAQSVGGATLLVLLSIAFVYVGARARAAKVDAVIAAESRAAIAEKLEQLPKQIDDLNIPAPLRELVAQIQEIEKRISDHGLATASTGHEEVKLRLRRATLVGRYLELALLLDGSVGINRSHIEPMSNQGTLGRIGALFISRGMFSSLQGAARIAYIVGAALLLPASLVAIGSSSPVATRLASTLDQVESFRIGFTAAEARAAVLKALESPQAAVKTTAEDASLKKDRTANAASDDWCSDQDASSDPSCDVVALQHAATMFERAYGNWLLPNLVPDGTREAVARRALVRHAIIQSDWLRPDASGGRVAARGDRTPPRDLLGTKAWRATRTVEIDAAALDSAYETPVRARFKAFVRSEVIDKHPAAWQRIKASIAAHGADFQRIPTQSQLAQQLALRVMGTLLGTAANDIAPVMDGALSAEGSALGIHTKTVDIQTSLFLEKLIQDGDLAAASRRLSELPRLAAGFTAREEALFQRLSPHIRAAADAAAAVLEQRPATLELRQNADFDLSSVVAASAKAAEARKMKNEALSSVKDYESLFPGGDPPASRGASRGPLAGGGGGVSSRSFVHMDRSDKIGGVVLGRPREPGPTLDVRNVSWRRVDGRISLLLETGQGTVVLNGFNPGIVHQSLVFAADDRKPAVTIVNTEVQAQKVLLHPAFVDTPLGCRIIALDKYVFDLTAQDEEVQASLTQARVQPLVYNYVVGRNAQVIGQLIEADGIGELNRKKERDAQVSQLRLAIQEIIPTNGASVFGTSLLKAAPDFFHSELVSTMASCAEAGTAMEAFDACVDAATKRRYLSAKRSRIAAAKMDRRSRTSPLEPGGLSQVSPGTGFPDHDAKLGRLGVRDGGSVAEKLARMARQLEGARNTAERDTATEARLDEVEIRRLMPPTTHLNTVSGVRESKWKLDRDFRFARVSTAGERAALDFFVHLPASTAPWFRPGVEPWYSADFRWESASAQAQPIRLSSIQQRIDAAIDRYFETPRGREEVPPFVQLIGLNRLFSAALSGDLGEQFPIEKLAELSRATGRDAKFAPTPRWILPSARASSRPALDPEFSELRKALRVDEPRGPGTLGPQGGAACPPI